MARSTPPVAILFALALALPTLATADDPLFFEDFESGDDGWTADGDGIGVSCGVDGCTLRVLPPCCGNATTFDHAVNVPLAGKLALDLDFRADSLYGDTDSAIWLIMDNGAFVILHTTEWFNNGLTLQTDVDSHVGFAEYWNASAWLDLRVLVDGDARLAQGQMLDANGTVVDASRVLSFGNGTGNGTATAITTVRVSGVTWNSNPAYGFDYDNLALAPSTQEFAEVACGAPYAYVWTPSEVSYPWTVDVYTDAWSECPIDSWSLDFGDGTAVAGIGYPWWYQTHAYNASGTYVITFTVHQEDGQSATSQTTVTALPSEERRQYASGHLRAAVAGMEPQDDGFVVLDHVATGEDHVELQWYATVPADLDLRFYDANGVPLGSTGCARLGVGSWEGCLAPEGAAYVDVTGTGVGATWYLTYTYHVDLE